MVDSKKVETYEAFINDTLKPNLRILLENREDLCKHVASYSKLQKTIEVIIDEGEDDTIYTKVDLGSNFYVDAEIEDREEIFVNLGLGIHLAMNFPEAIRFCKSKVNSLEKQIKEADDKIAENKAQIKFTLQAIGELQQTIIPQ